MSFTPNFSVSQNANNITQLVIVDSSVGSDGAIASREVSIQTGNSIYLLPTGNVGNFIAWLLANTSISINVLTGDFAVSIIVNWLASDGTTILYTKTGLYLFTAYSELFYYGLTQNQTSTPNIVNDNDYYFNKMRLRCSIDEATNALLYSDIVSAQSALNRAAYLISNQNLFF